MLVLARFADRGPFSAACLAAVLLLSALLVPVLLLAANGTSLLAVVILFVSMGCLVASAAVVSFVALKHGEQATIRVTASCLLMLFLVSMVITGAGFRVPLLAGVLWLPAIVASVVLARTVNFNFAVFAVMACGMLSLVLISLALGDSTAFWRSMLAERISPAEMSRMLEAYPEAGEAQLEGFIDLMAQSMNSAVGVMLMSIALSALCLARYWQGCLQNPGGFQKEFHALRFGRNMTLVGVGLLLLSVALGGEIFRSLTTVVIFGLAIQGIAVVHALVKQRGMHRFWLHSMYVLMILPHTLWLLAALGVADNFVSLRRTS